MMRIEPGSAAPGTWRGDIRRVAEHFAGRVDYHLPGIEADPRRKLRGALRRRPKTIASCLGSAVKFCNSILGGTRHELC